MDEGKIDGESARILRLAGKECLWVAIENRVKHLLRPKRLAHSYAVADESVAIGRRFGGDLVKLALAGLLHDAAKELGNEELIALGEIHGLITDVAERENPSLLHGPVCAWLARYEWGIDDPVILECVRCHTVAESGMSLEAGVVFMADLVEPSRSYIGVEILRKLCREDLRVAMIEALEQTFDYLDRKKLPVHGGARRCYAWLHEVGGEAWKAKI